jgi:transposase
MSATPFCVGIDVAKAHLDIALRPTGERWTVTTDDAGIAALVARLQAVPPTLLVLDATGATRGPWSLRSLPLGSPSRG